MDAFKRFLAILFAVIVICYYTGYLALNPTLLRMVPLKSQLFPYLKSISNMNYIETTEKTCQWHFLNYTPSAWESVWYENIEKFQNNVCERLHSSEHLNKTVVLAQRLIELQTFGRNKSMSETKKNDVLLSRMFYRRTCINPDTHLPFRITEISHSIEPLIGLLRDPFTMCRRLNSSLVPQSLYDGAIVQSKRIFLLSISAPFHIHTPPQGTENFEKFLAVANERNIAILPWMYQRLTYSILDKKVERRNSQTILFDLGSSYFGGWSGDTTAAAGLWFYEYFKRFGLKFDRIIAFEHSLLNQNFVWKQLPDDVLPFYTLVNVGVTESGKLNPWNVLRAVAKSYDHVIVKIDIDTPDIESALVNQILNDSRIHSLIDELFFEHHITVNEMMPYWGKPPGTLQDSYILFTKLRQLGIRMHSWP